MKLNEYYILRVHFITGVLMIVKGSNKTRAQSPESAPPWHEQSCIVLG